MSMQSRVVFFIRWLTSGLLPVLRLMTNQRMARMTTPMTKAFIPKPTKGTPSMPTDNTNERLLLLKLLSV